MVQGRSVASLRDAANVCVLALTGTLQFGGNAAINAPTCVFASNRRALAGVETNGNSFSVRAFSISTVGNCPNCTDSKFQLTQRPSEWQAPVANPFAHLDTKAIPNFTSGTCLTIENQFRANQNVTWQPYETNGGRARCGRTLQLTGNDVLTLLPGTHYIWEQSIRLQGGTLRCPTCTNGAGVTIVLTGSPANIGCIDINGGAATSGLRAPLNPTDADYKGVLLWRDGRGASGGNGGNPPVVVNGGANLNLMGGLHFPNAHSRFNGTAGTALCGVVVGGSFEFTGNAGVAQCNEVGTTVPRTRIVVVAE